MDANHRAPRSLLRGSFPGAATAQGGDRRIPKRRLRGALGAGTSPPGRRRRFVWAWALLVLLAAVGRAPAQDSPSVDPRVFGLDIPPGPVVHKDGLRVVTRDENGSDVVALVLVTVGDHRILILPDGRLQAQPTRRTRPTEQPFEALTKDEIARRLTSSELQGFKTKQTRRYLYIYNVSDSFALATSRILETMFPGVTAYVQSRGVDVRPPPFPLVVIMVQTAEQLHRFRDAPPGASAYYSILTNRVVLSQEKPLSQAFPELASQQSISTIAHEGAHQILHNIGAQQRLSVWPAWLSEGLAEFFAPTSVGKRLHWKGAGEVNDLRMFELEQYLKSRAAGEPDGRMIEQTVGGARLTSTGYASAWALTHFLAHRRRRQFEQYLQEISRIGPLEGNWKTTSGGIIPENVKVFQQHFGEDLADLEGQLTTYLRQLPYDNPFAQFPHFVVTVSAGAGRLARRQANVFASLKQAEAWRRETARKASASGRGAVNATIRRLPNRTQAEQAARQWLRRGP